MRGAFLAYARFARERPEQFRLITNPPDEPEALERIANRITELKDNLAAVLRDGIAAGDVRPDLDPDLSPPNTPPPHQ
jgi:hypothetical protein